MALAVSSDHISGVLVPPLFFEVVFSASLAQLCMVDLLNELEVEAALEICPGYTKWNLIEVAPRIGAEFIFLEAPPSGRLANSVRNTCSGSVKKF